jgi:hypothetical protein
VNHSASAARTSTSDAASDVSEHADGPQACSSLETCATTVIAKPVISVMDAALMCTTGRTSSSALHSQIPPCEHRHGDSASHLAHLASTEPLAASACEEPFVSLQPHADSLDEQWFDTMVLHGRFQPVDEEDLLSIDESMLL